MKLPVLSSRWRVRLIALVAVAAVITVTNLVYDRVGRHGLYNVTLPGGANLGAHPYSVTVDFADVLDLVPQSAVKVNDVAVGRVDSITLDGWQAKVKLLLNGSVSLPANATASIAQTSLLGEKYVSLAPPTAGTATGSLTDGAVIPLSRTSTNAQVEDVLGAISLVLSGGALNQVTRITTELNKALQGNTDVVRDLISQVGTFSSALNAQKVNIVTAIDGLGSLVQQISSQTQVLTTTLATLPSAIDVLNQERAQFVNLLTAVNSLASVANGVISSSSANIVAELADLQPVLEGLADAGTALPNALSVLTTFPLPTNIGTAIKGDYINTNVVTAGVACPTAGDYTCAQPGALTNFLNVLIKDATADNTLVAGDSAPNPPGVGG